MRVRTVALLVVLLAPLASASSDVVVTITEDAPPDAEGEPWLVLEDARVGDRYEWRLETDAEQALLELRVASGVFDVERLRQVVPHLHLDPTEPACGRAPGACDYTLFEPVSGTDLRELTGGARVANHSVENGTMVIRLSLPGPANGTLVLERDVTPPSLEVKDRENLTHGRFYQETRTTELAIVDLQVRERNATEWIQSPTPVYHFLQKFSIQGLDGDTAYEQRFVVTDWAGNSFASNPVGFRTPAAPVGPPVVVVPLSPEPNATLPAGGEILVSARIESNASAVVQDGVRVYFDLSELTEGWTYDAGVVTVRRTDVEPGLHVVRVEARNADGGSGSARWTFTVEDANETPATPPMLVALVAILLGAARRRAVTRPGVGREAR